MKTSHQWHKIAEDPSEIIFQPNDMAVMDVNGKKITLGRFQDQIFAFAHKCPHAGGLLAEGRIDGKGGVVCPLHRYCFDVRNGRNTSGEGYYLKHWPVEVRADGVYIGMEKGGLLSWL